MEPFEARLPTVDAYVKAFKAIERGITEKQLEALVFHHAQEGRVVTAATLAAAVGWNGKNAANLQYGRLAGEVCRELGVDTMGLAVGILVDFANANIVSNEHVLWIMRENVARALEALGWVPPVADYLYPYLAMQARRES